MRFFLSHLDWLLVALRAILRACGSSERGWRKWRHFALIDTLSRRQPSVLFRRRSAATAVVVEVFCGATLYCTLQYYLQLAARHPVWVTSPHASSTYSLETSAALFAPPTPRGWCCKMEMLLRHTFSAARWWKKFRADLYRCRVYYIFIVFVRRGSKKAPRNLVPAAFSAEWCKSEAIESIFIWSLFVYSCVFMGVWQSQPIFWPWASAPMWSYRVVVDKNLIVLKWIL
jgi:hypothetical protein